MSKVRFYAPLFAMVLISAVVIGIVSNRFEAPDLVGFAATMMMAYMLGSTYPGYKNDQKKDGMKQ